VFDRTAVPKGQICAIRGGFLVAKYVHSSGRLFLQLTPVLLAVLIFVPVLVLVQPAAAGNNQTINGTVQGNGVGLAGYEVSLYASYANSNPGWQLITSTVTDGAGHFQLSYNLASGQPVLFLEAEQGEVLLASCIGVGPSPASVYNAVVNERTTVAVANAFAQFVSGSQIVGNLYGMKNAASMAANLANPTTGAAGAVVSLVPNGSYTSTFPTFNSLANVVASCVANATNCASLFAATTPAGQAAPTNTLQAMANLVKYPAYPGYPADALDPVYLLSQANSVYQPALPHRPTSWLLFLKITGGFYTDQDATNLMDGPGAFAIDAKGNVWVDDNYIPQPAGHLACAGTRMMEFLPSGKSAPGSPFFGGGLSGQGWGVTLDPHGNLWIGNFGFQDPPCANLPQAAPSNSVSKFTPNGVAISPPQGYTQGNISWPMGTVSDLRGNIWIANCGNDTITMFPGGNNNSAVNISLGPIQGTGLPVRKPFGIAIDLQGNLWITGNRSGNVWELSPQGTLLKTLPASNNGITYFSHPIGNAADSKGNIWVANSDWLDAPCSSNHTLGTGNNPSVTLIQASTQLPLPPFNGGGITLPWGVAVDGDDTVWVFNFGSAPPFPNPPPVFVPTGISRLCGTNTSKCPPGMQTGDAISPSTGYQSDAFTRITAGAIDPSGNIWATNNWKIHANPLINPGENAIVIVIGAAAPVQTPLIGPPVPFP
jgi:hypothetical protein